MKAEDKSREEFDMENTGRKPVDRKIILAAAGLAAAVILLLLLPRGGGGEVKNEAEKEEKTVVWEGTMTEVSAMDIMCEPSGITAMEDGSLLVTDTYGKIIWQVKDGVSTVYAGGDTVEDPYGKPMGGYNDVEPENSYFKTPWAITPFLDGYAVSDTDNNVVRLVETDMVQTINGSTLEDLPVTDMGVAYDHPTGLASDEDGNLYIADTLQNSIRRVTPEGVVITYASGLSEPMGLCWKDGVLYVAETGANRIVKVEGGGNVSVVAGDGTDGFVNGAAEAAAFSMPQGVAVGDDGAIYVSDTGNSAIRRIQNGQVTTLVQRDVEDLEAFAPVSPVGLLVLEDQLYICDNFSRKVFSISLH